MLTVNKPSLLTLLPIILLFYGLGMLTGAVTQKHHDAHDKNDCITYVRSTADSFKTTAVKIDARCVVFPTETLYDCTTITTTTGRTPAYYICNLEPQHATTTPPLSHYECITIAPHHDAPKSKHKSQLEYKLPYKDDHGNTTYRFEEVDGICPTGNCLIQELQQ